jgi:hypothetical protein
MHARGHLAELRPALALQQVEVAQVVAVALDEQHRHAQPRPVACPQPLRAPGRMQRVAEQRETGARLEPAD